MGGKGGEGERRERRPQPQSQPQPQPGERARACYACAPLRASAAGARTACGKRGREQRRACVRQGEAAARPLGAPRVFGSVNGGRDSMCVAAAAVASASASTSVALSRVRLIIRLPLPPPPPLRICRLPLLRHTRPSVAPAAEENGSKPQKCRGNSSLTYFFKISIKLLFHPAGYSSSSLLSPPPFPSAVASAASAASCCYVAVKNGLEKTKKLRKNYENLRYFFFITNKLTSCPTIVFKLRL